MEQQRIAYRPAEALRVFPIGRTLLNELLSSGKIKSFTVGRARFIPHDALVAFMNESLALREDADRVGGAA